GTPISVDAALELSRTGDIWLFRGRSPADRAIRGLTNSPVNHVGMSVVIDDLPALMWHAELGRALVDHWSGTRQRGVQLHDLDEAVRIWVHRYGQRAWLRQLSWPVSAQMEDAVLRSIARLDGTPFPSTARLVGRWVLGRVPHWRGDTEERARDQRLESAYCAEVVALTYQAMGLLPTAHRANWYDAGRFWSGDDLGLLEGYELGEEIAVDVPPPERANPNPADVRRARRRRRLMRPLRRFTGAR
ncbi:MAG TPA: hypothetical protein VHH34_05720, partial [Pseudonocardiaceae bacterium]|nr:hypothetical protein [Pseudonocardiaceae bacterium]